MTEDSKSDPASTENQVAQPREPRPAPRVRPARVFRTLVLTALAALPMKAACSGARRGAEADRPSETVQAGEDGGTAGAADTAAEPREKPDGTGGRTDGGAEPVPADGSPGTVFRGGPGDEAGTSDAATNDPDGTGRVWRGGPDEEVNTGDRDAGTRDDGRARREDAGPPRRDVGEPVPAYAVPMPEYGVPIPDPMPQPLYGVEPYPDPAPAYALPHPEPVTDYGVTAPPFDDDGMVLRYGVPFDD